MRLKSVFASYLTLPRDLQRLHLVVSVLRIRLSRRIGFPQPGQRDILLPFESRSTSSLEALVMHGLHLRVAQWSLLKRHSCFLPQAQSKLFLTRRFLGAGRIGAAMGSSSGSFLTALADYTGCISFNYKVVDLDLIIFWTATDEIFCAQVVAKIPYEFGQSTGENCDPVDD